jgi:NAD(P)-dependent dehydrogenase (short-subunit alcohol dehydrogenase family)
VRFEGKTVAITGGGGGIGRALVLRFAAEGASVRCIDIDGGRARAAAAAAGDAAEAVVADVTVAEDVARALAGHIDVLVNNTLSATGDNLVTIDEESWRRDLDGTLTSAFLCIRAVLPGMVERGGGAIVNVASVNGLGYYGNEAYSAAKAGLINLSGSVAARYGRHGVRANSVAPGTIRTAAWDERLAREPDLLTRLARWYPLGRIGTPDEVASPVLTVDGGLTTGQVRMADELLVESRDAEV